MAKGVDIITYLRPEGGWVISGDDFEGIQFIECEPFTKKEFQDAFSKYDVLIAKQEAEKEAAKNAILAKIGLTAEEVSTLLA